jgi:hypothetical protein
MKKEVWKQISGYEGMYEISDIGRARSVDRIGPDGKNYKGKPLTPALNRTGYYFVRLRKDGHTKSFKIHRLVAMNFIPNENDKSEVNHIDGNKTNNVVGNLEWVSRSENLKHAFKIGLKSVEGERNPKSKLTKADVEEIRRRLSEGEFQKYIASDFGITIAAVSDIKTGKRWRSSTKSNYEMNRRMIR